MRIATKVTTRILTYMVIFAFMSQVATAQVTESDTRVTAIEMIGRDLVRLLNQLTEGEKDPTKRLPISPILDKAAKAVQDSPTFQQAQSSYSFDSGPLTTPPEGPGVPGRAFFSSHCASAIHLC